MHAQLGLHELARRPAKLALDVALLDRFRERDVAAVLAGVLGCVERDLGRQPDRGIEQDEPRHGLRRAGRELERKPASEGVAHVDGGLRTDGAHHRCQMRVDVPRRLVGGGAVAEEVGREHVGIVERVLREEREMPAVTGDAVEADDPRSARVAPLVQR
jgi:hypothetical protein